MDFHSAGITFMFLHLTLTGSSAINTFNSLNLMVERAAHRPCNPLGRFIAGLWCALKSVDSGVSMRNRVLTLIPYLTAATVFTYSLSHSAAAQEPATPQVTRDPKAMVVLNQAVAAAGGVTALTAINDFTGSGEIEYFWSADETEAGRVTLKALGRSKLQLEASLPRGKRNWGVNNGRGYIRETDGTITPIEGQNTRNFEGFGFALLRLVAIYQDSSMGAAYLGLDS